jgi:hypothetical protein
MSTWPKPENEKIPEGHYQFRLNREPEFKKFPYVKNGIEKEGTKIVVFAVGLGEKGQFSVRDEIVTWDPRYADLCSALHVEHGRDIQVAGAVFEADIVHEPDRKDPTKSWPRMANISGSGDGPATAEGEGDDIPF